MMLVILRPAAHRRLKQQVLGPSLSMNGSVSDPERLRHAWSRLRDHQAVNLYADNYMCLGSQRDVWTDSLLVWTQDACTDTEDAAQRPLCLYILLVSKRGGCLSMAGQQPWHSAAGCSQHTCQVHKHHVGLHQLFYHVCLPRPW